MIVYIGLIKDNIYNIMNLNEPSEEQYELAINASLQESLILHKSNVLEEFQYKLAIEDNAKIYHNLLEDEFLKAYILMIEKPTELTFAEIINRFKVIPQSGDGNCLFRSIASAFYGDAKNHLHVRNIICDYLQYWSELKNFTTDDNYVSTMRHDGVWGDECEICAFSNMYNIHITVYDVQKQKVYEYGNQYDNKINLRYTNSSHYDLLI